LQPTAQDVVAGGTNIIIGGAGDSDLRGGGNDIVFGDDAFMAAPGSGSIGASTCYQHIANTFCLTDPFDQAPLSDADEI
jgi:hypothetical protein